MTEKQIENDILEYLLWLPGAEFWKVDTVGVWDAKKKIYRKRNSKFRTKGISDIIGFYRGKFYAFEVKRPDKRGSATPDQQLFLDTAREQGQIANLVCSLNEVIEIMEAA